MDEDKLPVWESGKRGRRLKEVPIGQRFGELVITGRAPSVYKKSGDSGGVYVFVKCDCGTESRMRLSAVANRGVKSCGRASHWDRRIVESGQQMIGQQFGALTVVAATADRHTAPGGSRAAQVLVRCDCGTERYARITDLRGGSIRSCNGDAHKDIKPQVKRWEVHGKRKTYAIEAVGTGLVKIGAARDFKKRMWKLQPMCPVELRMIAASDDDIEARMHVQLDAHRVHGEWFHANDEVLAAIAALLEPASMSVLGETLSFRKGKPRGGKCRCKRCGELGHFAKTCIA